MEKVEKKARLRRFATLFDGDEIDGKFYRLGEPVTGLDAPTGTFLVQIGRLEEISEEHFDKLVLDAKSSEAAVDAGGDAFANAAAEAFAAGNIPSDLVNPDAAADADDKLVTKTALLDIAKAEGVEVKSSATKIDIAVAVMASRLKADAGTANE